MTADERLAASAERFADVVHEAIATRVRYALALEQDRRDAEIAELRDEILTHAQRNPGASAALEQEVAALNDRVARLTSTVARLMRDSGGHSVRVEP